MDLAKRIYEMWGELDNEPPRVHLGASLIGSECERSIQLSYRWAYKPVFGGRIHRLFDVGHKFEDRLYGELQAIGVEVSQHDQDGNQYRLGPPDGLCGSCDGFVNLDGVWGVLEAKTHNDKSFKQLEQDEVFSAKPEHYAQMQVYMGYSKRPFALYCAENKNTSELYFEVVKFDQKCFEEMLERASRVQTSNQLLPALAGASETFYKCKFCNAFEVCHGQKVPQINCRTCMNWTAPNECRLGGCREHERHVFHPMFAPWKPVTGDVDWVRYDNDIVNCEACGFPTVTGGEPLAIMTSKELLACGTWKNAVKMAEVKNQFGGEIEE